MNPQLLKVRIGMGIRLNHFMIETGALMKKGVELTGIEKEYIDNIARIEMLSHECLYALGRGEPWRIVFETFTEDAGELQSTLFDVPALGHMHALEHIASTYNRCIGVTYWHDFLLGGTLKQIVNVVKSHPVPSAGAQAKLDELLHRVRTLITQANMINTSPLLPGLAYTPNQDGL